MKRKTQTIDLGECWCRITFQERLQTAHILFNNIYTMYNNYYLFIYDVNSWNAETAYIISIIKDSAMYQAERESLYPETLV